MQICRNVCKSLDNDAYLCSLFYPHKYRGYIWALRALNAECAIDGKRAAFYKLDIKQKQTPMSQFLPPLNQYWLNKMIDCKLVHKHNTLEELEEYCESSYSSILYISSEIIGVKDIKIDHILSHIGKCTGLINTIRGVGHFAKKRQSYLPIYLMAKHNVTEEDIYRGNLDKLPDVIHEIASRAYQHKETALEHLKSVPKEAFPLMLHLVPNLHYLKVLEDIQFDVSNKLLYKKNIRLLFQLAKCNLIKKVV
eukprot:NODE_754_length_4537_cov_0.586525.p2 type:complete len:251 gc:universal NODE_754_length_4537_cov_0.586525:2051-2803(+)